MSKTDLEKYQSSSSPARGAKLKCTTEICELYYGGGKEKVREREQEKEDQVSLRKKKSKDGTIRTRKQQHSANDSVEQSNYVDERTTDREITSRNGSMKKSKKSKKRSVLLVPENENSPPGQKDKKNLKVQEDKPVKLHSGEAPDPGIFSVTPEKVPKQVKASKEKALSKSFKKQMREKEKDSVNKGKHLEHEKDDETTPRKGKSLPPIVTEEVERINTAEKKTQKESKFDRKEKEKDNNNGTTKKRTNTAKELLTLSSVIAQPKQSNMCAVTGDDDVERKVPINSNKQSVVHHNSDDYHNHFISSSKEFISTKTQEFYFDNPNSNDVRENHQVMEEFSTLRRPNTQESKKTVRNPSYSASTKTINVDKLLQDDDDDEARLKENKVDKRQMDPRTNDLDELVQIPMLGMMMINMDDARTPTPATACASTMTTRPRKMIRNKPSQNSSSNHSNNNNNPTTTSNNSSNMSNTSNQGKVARIKTSGKSSSKASRKHSRIDGAKNGGGGGGGGNSLVNSNLLVNGTKQSIGGGADENNSASNNNNQQPQQSQQAQNQSQSTIKHSKSQHQQQRQSQQQQQQQNLNTMGNEVIGTSNSSNITSSGKNQIKESSVQNSSSFRRKTHPGQPPSAVENRVRRWKKGGASNIEKILEKEYTSTSSAEILAAVQQQLALADLNHGSQGKQVLHGRFHPTMFHLQSKLDKNNTLNPSTVKGGGGGGVNGNGQINYSTNNNNVNLNLNSLVGTSPRVRSLPGKSSRLIHPNLRKMSRISQFYANNGSIANSNTNSSNNNTGVINIPAGGSGGGSLTLPNRGGKLSSSLNKRNGAGLKLNNSLAKREQSLKNVERAPKKIDSWNYHSRDDRSEIDIRKELKGLWDGGGVKEFSF